MPGIMRFMVIIIIIIVIIVIILVLVLLLVTSWVSKGANFPRGLGGGSQGFSLILYR